MSILGFPVLTWNTFFLFKILLRFPKGLFRLTIHGLYQHFTSLFSAAYSYCANGPIYRDKTGKTT